MIGAIAGDIIGSAYEFHRTKAYNFQIFERFSNGTQKLVTRINYTDRKYTQNLRKTALINLHMDCSFMCSEVTKVESLLIFL